MAQPHGPLLSPVLSLPGAPPQTQGRMACGREGIMAALCSVPSPSAHPGSYRVGVPAEAPA